MDSKLLRFYGQLSAALMSKFIAVLLAAWVGYKLDARWGTYPWMSVGLVSLAATGGIVFVLRTANRLEAEQKKAKDPPVKNP